MPAPQHAGDDRPLPGWQQDPSLGRLLRQLRLRARMTQEVLAERAGVSVATIAALEEDRRRRPYPNTMAALAEALELGPDERAALQAVVPLRGQALDLAPSTSAAQPRAPGPAPPAASARVRLPVPPMPLIGRDSEVAAAAAVLDPARSALRLLTLVGPGGMGKTRLGLAVATALADAYADGVVFVDLAPLRDHRLVPAAIAHALAVRESGGRSARELLLTVLREQQVLLVLDNFEHLLGGAPLLAELLAGCPRLGLLITSRAPLRLRGEQRWPVSPLPTPAAEADPSPAALTAAPAVRLFVERAQAIAPDFLLDTSNAAAVAGICRRLEGMPLAIELAAARVGLLRPEALLRRLERRLPLLTGGATDLPERQQTLRQTLAWSHDLLGPAEQMLFRRLAVFTGGWTLEAAEAVCAGPGLESEDVLERLGALVDNSLVHRAVGADGEPRFGMLETIREYAQERLEMAGNAEDVGRRHLDWCLALVQPKALVAPVALVAPDPKQIARLAPEHDNLRIALREAIDGGAAQEGLWLASALWMPWYVRGSYAEGWAWLTELLAMPGAEAATLARANALIAAGHLAYCQGEYVTAELLLEDARRLTDRLRDDQLGGVVLHVLASVARGRGDLARARSLYGSALEVSRRLGHRMWEATVLSVLANVFYEQGEHAQAGACAEESLAFFTETSNTWGVARSLYALGRVASAHGDHTKSRSLHQTSLALQRELADHQGMAWSLVALANEVVRSGDGSAARQLYTESLALADKTGDRLTLMRSLEGLASVMATAGPERAVRLAGAADAVRADLGATAHAAERQALEAWLSAARGALGEPQFSKAWTAGHALSAPQAVAEALQLPAALAGDRVPLPALAPTVPA